MSSENILAINVPNIVSITVMAVVGGLAIGLAKRALSGKRAGESEG